MRIGRLTPTDQTGAATQQTSGGLCHEDVWVRQWSERSCRSGQEIDRVMAGRWKHRLTAAVLVRVDCLESAPVMSSPLRRGLDGGHNTATAVELGWCRRARSYADGQDQRALAHGLKFLRRMLFSRFHRAPSRTACRMWRVRVWWLRFPRL